MKWQYINQIERILLIPFILLMTVLVTINAINILNNRQNTAMQNNSQEYNLRTVVSPYGEITMEIDEKDHYPELQLLINGVLNMEFNNEKRVTIKVKDGDLIQINGSMYPQEINVVVKEASSNIKRTSLPQSTVIHGNIQVVSTIRIQ